MSDLYGRRPDEYVVVRNWRRFQHYKERNPPWIKNHVELLHSDNYLRLTGEQRAILHGLWLEYSSSHCQLAADTSSLSRRLNLRVTRAQLERLQYYGFIEIALAPSVQHASATRAREEAEAEAEQKTEIQTKAFGPLEARYAENGKASRPEDFTFTEQDLNDWSER